MTTSDGGDARRQRRAVATAIVAALGLTVVGVVASAVVSSGPCDDLLPAALSAPPAVSDGAVVISEVAPDVDGPALAAALVTMGDELGLGPVRGATASGAAATLVPFEDGTVVAADGDHVRILDNGLVAVASGRERIPGTRVVRAGELMAVVHTGADGDDLVARYDAELDLTACRPLERPGDVVHVDSGLAIVAHGDDVELVRLDRGPLWDGRDVLTAPAVDGDVTGELALVASRNEIVAFDRRTGEQVWRVTTAELGGPLPDDPLLLAGDDVVLATTLDRVARIDGGTGVVQALTAVEQPATGAVGTADGAVVVAGRDVLRVTPDDTRRTRLPVAATGAPAARGRTVFVPIDGGLARVDADGTVTTATEVPVASVTVSDAYTTAAVAAGDGLLVFYGPAPVRADGTTSGD